MRGWRVQRTATLVLFAAATWAGVVPADFYPRPTLRVRRRLKATWHRATKGFEMTIDFCQAGNHHRQKVFAFFRWHRGRAQFWIGVAFMG